MASPLRLAALGLALAAAAGGCERTTRDTDIKLIRVAEVKSLMDRQARGERDLVVLVDPRPPKHFEAGHIPGARNVTLPQVDPKGKVDSSIDRHHTIVVYGADPASAEARGMTKRMIAVGYSRVRLFAGGMKEWTGRGYAVDGQPPAPVPAPAPSPTPAPTVVPVAGETPAAPEPQTPADAPPSVPPTPTPEPAPSDR